MPCSTCTGDEINYCALGQPESGIGRFEGTVASDMMCYVTLDYRTLGSVTHCTARVYGSRGAKRVPYPCAFLPRAPFAQACPLTLTPSGNYPSAYLRRTY